VQPAKQFADPRHAFVAAPGRRQQLGDLHLHGLGDGLEHDDGRIALPAFDLRQVPL
jgi:hypothetical protein